MTGFRVLCPPLAGVATRSAWPGVDSNPARLRVVRRQLLTWHVMDGMDCMDRATESTPVRFAATPASGGQRCGIPQSL